MGTDSDAETNPARARAGIEASVRAHVEAGELDVAASRALEHYGPELYGLLRAIARDDDLAADAFANASEQLWRHLAQFRWEASLRTWAYQLARNALHRLRRDPRRRPERNLPLSIVHSIEAVKRSATDVFQRTEVKAAFRALRESLDPLDHEILILRLDRGMSWKDVARSLTSDDDPDDLERRAAAYRLRFARAKARLRDLAIEHGLIAED